MLQHCCHRERRSRTERLFLYHNIYLHSMVFLSNEFSNSAKSKLLSMYPCRIVSMSLFFFPSISTLIILIHGFNSPLAIDLAMVFIWSFYIVFIRNTTRYHYSVHLPRCVWVIHSSCHSFSYLHVLPLGLLSCPTSHSGSFFKWCHKMKPACFKFVSIKSKAVGKDVSHNCNFLFW